MWLMQLSDKNDKKYVKVLVNEDTQKAQGFTNSPSENSSLSEVLLMSPTSVIFITLGSAVE